MPDTLAAPEAVTASRFAPRVFSGIKPSGGLTLGNYLGAIKRFVETQDAETFETTLFCVVDLHAITVWQDPAGLRDATREVAAGYLAAGIDPEKSILFNQSRWPSTPSSPGSSTAWPAWAG